MNSDVLRHSIGVNFTLLSIHRKKLFYGSFPSKQIGQTIVRVKNAEMLIPQTLSLDRITISDIFLSSSFH